MLEWKEEYQIGIESVDHEHRELIDLINNALTLLQQVTDSTGARNDILEKLGDIHGLTSGHFALEEKEMQTRHYADYEPHKDDHEALLDSLLDFIEEAEHNAESVSQADLESRLSLWFSEHFRTHDAAFHRFIEPSSQT